MRHLFFILFLTFTAGNAFASKSAQTVIHLLSYLGNDYSGAVKDGKVISESEYKEQVEFSLSVEKFASDDSIISKDSTLMTSIKELTKLIANKGSSDEVANQTKLIAERVIKVTGLETSPVRWPNLANGKNIYNQNCAQCHGSEGLGDGPAGVGLDPAPASFHDVERLTGLSSYQLFNTITLGVEGTGMPPFGHLSESDRWDLAFFANSIRFGNQTKKPVDELINSGIVKLSQVANLNDTALKDLLSGDEPTKNAILAGLRTFRKSDDASGFTVASVNKALDDSFILYVNGDFKEAKLRAVEAYLQEFEPIERGLNATGQTSLVGQIEQAMQVYRSQIDARVEKELLAGSLTKTKDLLQQVERLQSKETTITPSFAFISSFSIVLREGFEAVLILIALIAVLKSLSAKHALKWVHAGWISAVISGIVFWVLSGQMIKMSGASKEAMEGFTSLLAVAMLLGIGFWLHQKSQISKWKSFIEGRVKEALTTGKLFALALIAFMAVFREAFETVLFLRALSIDEHSSGIPVLLGVTSSFTLVFLLSWLTLKYSVRLPIRRLFQFSSFMMAVLSFVLVGKGLKELQEANLIPATLAPISFRVDLLGLFPTYETIAAQVLILCVIGLLIMQSREPSAERVLLK